MYHIYLSIILLVTSNGFAAPGEDDLPFWECIDKNGKNYNSYAPCNANKTDQEIILQKNLLRKQKKEKEIEKSKQIEEHQNKLRAKKRNNELERQHKTRIHEEKMNHLKEKDAKIQQYEKAHEKISSEYYDALGWCYVKEKTWKEQIECRKQAARKYLKEKEWIEQFNQ